MTDARPAMVTDATVTEEMIEAARKELGPFVSVWAIERTYLAMHSAMNGDVVERDELLNDIAVMMSEFVDNWPQPKKVSTALALISKTLRTALGDKL